MAQAPQWKIEDVPLGSALAEAVYRFWYAHYVEAQGLFKTTADHAARRLTDGCDATARLFAATLDGEIVGTMRLNWGADAPFDAGTVADFSLEGFLQALKPAEIGVFSRLIVAERFRAGFLAAALIQRAARFATEHGIELLFGDCELHLINRYTPLGLRPYGQLLNHPTSGLLIPMVLVRSDLAWLEQVRSPLTPIFTRRPPRPDAVDAVRPLVHDARAVLLTEALVGTERFVAAVSAVLSAHHDHPYPLFAGLDDDQLRRLLRRAHLLDARPGDALILEGHVSRTLYVVLSGQVEVRVDGRVIASAGPGAAVGEIAFFLRSPRSADVFVGADGAQVLALNNQAVHQLIDEDAGVAARFLLNMTRTLCGKVSASARLLGG